MTGSAALAAAYRATRYVCHLMPEPGQEITLRAGQPVPDRLSWRLRGYRVRAGALITAFNPHSRALSNAENAARNEQLRALLNERDHDYCPASGIGGDPAWAAEHGYLLLGVDAEHAVAIAEIFEQYAIVVAPAGGAVAIRFTALWQEERDEERQA